MNIKEVWRRVMMLAGMSRVTSLSDQGNVQKVQVQTPLDLRNDTLRFAEFGFSSGLPNGTDVIVLSLGGDRSAQVAVASNHNGFRHEGLQPGEVVVYNQWGLYVKLKEDEIEVEAKGQKVNINNASDVKVQASGTVTIDVLETKLTGNLTVCGITTTKGLIAGGGGGEASFTGVVNHNGEYNLTGDFTHEGGSMSSDGRKIDGTHVHPESEGGTTERPNP
jgi:phage gp45-like